MSGLMKAVQDAGKAEHLQRTRLDTSNFPLYVRKDTTYGPNLRCINLKFGERAAVEKQIPSIYSIHQHMCTLIINGALSIGNITRSRMAIVLET